MGPMFGPAVVSNPTGGFPSGTMDIGTCGGGTNWPGAGFNPETQVVFAAGGQCRRLDDRPGAAAGRSVRPQI